MSNAELGLAVLYGLVAGFVQDTEEKERRAAGERPIAAWMAGWAIGIVWPALFLFHAGRVVYGLLERFAEFARRGP